MLGFSKVKRGALLAVCTGTVSVLDNIADDVFSQRLLGDGFAQSPEDGVVRAPADGIIAGIADTKHAYCIDTNDGAQVLVHIGIDTVKLKGEGFSPKVEKGSRVRAGEILAEVDMDMIKEKGFDNSVITLITNVDAVKGIEIKEGRAQGGVTTVLKYKM